MSKHAARTEPVQRQINPFAHAFKGFAKKYSVCRFRGSETQSVTALFKDMQLERYAASAVSAGKH